MKAVRLSGPNRVRTRQLQILLVCLALLGASGGSFDLLAAPQTAQQQETKPTAGEVSNQPQRAAGSPTPLAALVEEALRNDPVIVSADKAAQAATHVAPQVSTLPDPQFTLQHFSVGSPRPFAGYSNSNFAYIGFGASQDLPYPGKLRLRGEIANREVDVLRERVEAVRRDEIEKLKAAYFRLAYLQQTLGILERNDALAQQVAQVAEARYRVGQGNQQDVLKAQLQHTKIVYQISMHHQLQGEAEAEIKRILRRPQDSPDVVTEPLSATPLRYTSSELLARVPDQNSEVRERAEMVRKNQTGVDLAHREFRPDFGLSYMYEHTSSNFRDYYVVTFNVNFPRRRRREAALAEANANLIRARQEQDAQLQGSLAEVQRQMVIAQKSEEQLRIYREGLIPQALATFEAGMAAYQVGRQDFETLLSAFLDVLNLDLEYQRTFLDRETAMVRIERLTGVSLP